MILFSSCNADLMKPEPYNFSRLLLLFFTQFRNQRPKHYLISILIVHQFSCMHEKLQLFCYSVGLSLVNIFLDKTCILIRNFMFLRRFIKVGAIYQHNLNDHHRPGQAPDRSCSSSNVALNFACFEFFQS